MILKIIIFVFAFVFVFVFMFVVVVIGIIIAILAQVSGSGRDAHFDPFLVPPRSFIFLAWYLSSFCSFLPQRLRRLDSLVNDLYGAEVESKAKGQPKPASGSSSSSSTNLCLLGGPCNAGTSDARTLHLYRC